MLNSQNSDQAFNLLPTLTALEKEVVFLSPSQRAASDARSSTTAFDRVPPTGLGPVVVVLTSRRRERRATAPGNSRFAPG
jgi:hypothetical protein